MRTIPVFLFVLLMFSSTVTSAQESEDDYADLIQEHLGGEREVAVTSGFIDLLTTEYAIEVEFARKWKQAIGQALWYGLQTSKTPGIVLIKKDNSDLKYAIQLGSALDYAGLAQKIRVWIWPDDFGAGSLTRQGPAPDTIEEVYWLTFSSNKRHNAGCTANFRKTKGRVCRRDEGVACKICGG